MTKKILSILLALVMVLAMAPVSVFAEDDVLSYITYFYNYNHDRIIITDCDTSISGDIVIPDTIEGYPVTEIDFCAFSDCENLTSITIPDSVTFIGWYAFSGCTSLESITIPDRVTSIDDGTFCDCTSLESITIPDSVTYIGYHAFSGCTSLTSIEIPDSVTSIGDDAFYNTAYYNDESNWNNSVLYIGNHLIKAKADITECEIKDGTLTIADSAFSGCTSLASITIPNSVTLINTIPEYTVIYGCSNSSAKEYADTYNRTFVSIDDFSSSVVTAPTCTEEGYTTYTCTICGSFTDDYVDALGHTLDDGVITAPTCSEQGYTTYTCIVCGDSYADDYVDTLDHILDDGVVTAPTCIEQGYTTYTCSVCGYSYVDDYVDALGHVDENADSKCEVCDRISLASGGFFFSVTDAEVGETVEVTIGTDFDGFKSGSFKIHYDHQYLEYVSCKGLNQRERPTVIAGIPQGYTPEDDIINGAMMVPTYITGTRNFITLTFNVLKAGNSTLSVDVGDWDANSTPANASIPIGVLQHEHDYAEVVTAPTCTEQGYTTYTCIVCGDSYVDDYVDALGQHIDENEDSACDMCGRIESGGFFFNITDAQVGETVEVTIGTDFDGFRSGVLQINFNPEYLEYIDDIDTYIPGFDVVAGIPVGCTQADGIVNAGLMSWATQSGTLNFVTLKFRVLKAGSSTLSVNVLDWNADSTPANANITIGVHEHDYAEVVTAPTCVEAGYITYTCSVCGDSYVDNYDYLSVPHNFGDDMYCDVCGEYALYYGIENDTVIIYGCDRALTGSVVIPDTIEGYPVTCIWGYAFAWCEDISEITISASVTEIEVCAFNCCVSLERFIVNENNPNYSSDEDGILYNKDKTAIVAYPCNNANVEYVMPDSVATITTGAFEASAIETVAISNNVTEIVYATFADCTSLKSVDIPDSVKSISAKSFVNCDSLKEITVPESVTSIDEYSIGYCFDFDAYEYKLIDGVTVYGYAGSAAETYANENGITFVALCKHETTILKNVVEATCTADGYTGDVHCKACDELLANGEVVTATGHTEEVIPEVPATYTAAGLTEGKKCSVCGVVLVEQTEIPMLINPNLTTDSADITVTDKLANLTPEMSVEDIKNSVENENVQIFDKDGAELATDALVGTGSKVQVVDKNGKVLSEYEVMVKSDVDGNGKITPADARLALRASAGLDIIEGVYETAANYDGQDTISTSDARMILRKAAGLE